MLQKTLRQIIFTGLFCIPFIPFLVSNAFFFPFIVTKAFAFRIIVEIILAAWAVLITLEPDYRPKRSYIMYALALFLGIIFIADMAGTAPLKSFWSNFERMEGFISLLHFGAFFIVAGSVFGDVDWKRWWNTSLVASGLMVIYCLFQLGGVISQTTGRTEGTFGNAAYLAVYMLIHIFVALFYATRNKSLKWIYGFLILAQTIILYYTATRGAILGLLGGLFIVAVLNIWNKENKGARKAGIVGVVAVLVLLVGGFMARETAFFKSSPVLSRFSDISLESIKGEGRAYIWPMALQGIKEHPILGWGQENFNYVFNEHYSAQMYGLEQWFDRAHNIFLDWAIAGGMLGLLGYLALYIVLIVYIWKKDTGFTFTEKTILTGLIAAYFFHNIFVFDNLGSYILFFALLAQIHSRVEGKGFFGLERGGETAMHASIAAAGIALIAVMYIVNVRPLSTNINLLDAVSLDGGVVTSNTIAQYKDAYNSSPLGRPEVVEYMLTNAPSIFSSDLTAEQKASFATFATDAARTQAASAPDDARYQLFTGSYFARIGQTEEGITYLERAKTLSPEKQAILFQLGVAYMDQGNLLKGLQEVKEAYDLAPAYNQAQVTYLYALIRSKDTAGVNKLISTIPEDQLVQNDGILGALSDAGYYQILIPLLEKRIAASPDNAAVYISAAATYIKSGQNAKAIDVLKRLAVAVPDQQAQVDATIKAIQSGQINKSSF